MSGGTLTWASYQETPGLDPIVNLGSFVGGSELGAVYDTIMRWNSATNQYDNNMNESIEHNAAFTEWVLKLKPGITFSDGSPFNADAVRFGMNRHRSGLPGAPPCEEMYACPRNGVSTTSYMALVQDIQVVDDLTVKFVLNAPWARFPYALSSEPGMIPSPTAIKAACEPKQNVTACSFNLKPVGAGAFVVDSFVPGDAIRMSRNPTYWNGPVYLDHLNFVVYADGGGERTYEALRGGQVQGGILRDPQTVAAAHEDGMAGLSAGVHGAGLLIMNTGARVTCAGGKPEPTCVGKPDGPTQTTPSTSNPLVRRAVAAAIDTNVINERAYGGKAKTSLEYVQADFPWYPGPNGPTYDPGLARQLVTQAKAAGWDGKIEMSYHSAPFAQSVALAVQAMLQAAGMDASVDTTQNATNHSTRVINSKDFELSGWAMQIDTDDGALWAFTQNLLSTSPSNRLGYTNLKVDSILNQIRTSSQDEQIKQLYSQLFTELATDVPIIALAKFELFRATSPNLHGVVATCRERVLFEKAWLST